MSTLSQRNWPVDGVAADTVLTDNRGGARRGTGLLLRHGHRRIAFFGDGESLHIPAQRRCGFIDAHTPAGAPEPGEFCLMASPLTIDGSVTVLIGRMLQTPDPPTAIFSEGSVQLLQAMRARTESLGFVGFDDFELADVLDPGVTVTAHDPAAMGRLAAELLVRRIEGDDTPPQRVELATTLVRRGSGELAGPLVTNGLSQV